MNTLSRFIGAVMTVLLIATPMVTHAASWDPTLLVNTEAFQIIDDGDGSSDIYLQFGDSAAEQIIWDISNSSFLFTDDARIQGNLDVEGNISASGSITLNADDTGDATLNFVGPGADQTVIFSDSNNRFEFSSGAVFDGAISGTTLRVQDLQNCEVIYSDADGNLQCATDDYLTTTEADGLYVNQGGDTMTGDLIISNGAGLTASGDLLTEGDVTLNKDNAAQDAVLTFGNDAGAEILRFSDTTNQFEFTDDVQVGGDLHTTGDITGSGTLKIESTIAQDGDDLTINADGTAGDTTLTFGNQSGNETIIYDDSEDEFEFSDDISVQGTLSGTSLTVDTGTVEINGVTYSFTGTQGGSNQVLTNDGAGNLTWSNPTVGNGSGSIVSLHPAYPGAIYEGDGSSNVGRLRTIEDGSNNNAYRWSTSRSALQDYDIVVRIRVPDNFDSWTESGVTLYYKTATAVAADNRVDLEVIDTAGSSDYTSGALNTANVYDTHEADDTDLNGTYTAGEYMTVRVRLSAKTATNAYAGWLNFNWNTTTP